MSKSICVLGEDRHLSMLVSAAVASKGHKVVAETSGKEILTTKNGNGKADLYVVTDELSDIDGIGWITKLRATGDDTPVVFVSKGWQDREFYKMMRDDLKVSLVAHRPLKAAVFGVQLRHLLNGGPTSVESSSVQGAVVSAQGPVFERLKAKFINSLPKRLDKIDAFLSPALQGMFNRGALDHAVTAAHNLKGTSLSWDLEELGAVAERMESLLRHILVAPDERQPLVEEAHRALEHLIHCIEVVTKTHNEHSPQPAVLFDSSKAQVLLVSERPFENLPLAHSDSMPVDFIQCRPPEAIETATNTPLDAAVIEIQPGQKAASLTVARELRDVAGCDNLPLAFLSDDEVDDRVELTHAGGSMFLKKPLDPNDLSDMVTRLIAMREGGRFRVLVVDDDEDLAGLTCGNLGQFGILTRAVNDPLLVDAALADFNPDMALLDVHMPALSGFEICRSIRNSPRWRDLPVLFLTAQTDLASRLTAYEVGADDYLPKPVISAELLTRVKVRLERSRELKERSERDLLTGLLLRRAFCVQMETLMHSADARFSIALLDLDRFKGINDKYGHQAGDDVLAAFGRLLRRRFRVEDLRARWGGEEFILAFMREGKAVLQRALLRVMEELQAMTFTGEDNETFHVTFSGGVADYPEEGHTLKELVMAADKRLYLSKERGRKQVTIED